MFLLFTGSILVLALLCIAWAVIRVRDTLHPFVYLMPMLLYVYVLMPYALHASNILPEFYDARDLAYVQGLYLCSIAALAVGCVLGSGGVRRKAPLNVQWDGNLPETWRRDAFRLGVFLGCLSLLLHLYQIANVGGFVAAYSTAKGGGWSESGYVRDLEMLALPAIVLIFLSRLGQPLSKRHWLLILIFALPTLTYGLLSARRGATFRILVTLGGGWFLTRGTRPRPLRLAAAGFVLGAALILLVNFRGMIYLGSSFFTEVRPSVSEMVEALVAFQTRSNMGNEYIAGANVVLSAEDEKDFFWGTRYLTQVFIRPIPSQVWPTKYKDVGMESLTFNAGTLGRDFKDEKDDVITGTSPGLMADLFVEFAWGSLIAAFMIGWGYGFAWKRAMTRKGLWLVIYAMFVVFSIFLVSQTFFAMAQRTMIVLIPTVLLWKRHELLSSVTYPSPSQ